MIGPAANEAARIEGLTKELEYSVLASAKFADRCSSPLKSVGEFELRGVSQKEQIFVPQALPGF